MTKARLIYKNFWRNGVIVSQSTEHPQFPVEFTQDDILILPWQSRHGTGTGNGQFVVTATNKYIDFDEGAGELVATLTTGTYTAQTLVAEIKVRMDAAGGTYTVSYDELTGKFTISSTPNFTIRWLNGTHHATNVSGLLGYSNAANDTGTNTFIGDYVSIHTSENLVCDFGSALAYDFIALWNHNLTTGATITLKGADDAAITSNVVTDSLTYNGNNICQFLSAARTKRYCQVLITDPMNPSMYVQIGNIVVGKYFEPSRSFGPYSEGPVDTSEIEFTPSKNMLITQEQPKLTNRDLKFTGLNDASALQAKALLLECGVTKGFVLCFDSTTPNGNTYWVHARETTPPECSQKGYWTFTLPVEEML
jgi:hypothetical protein